MTYNHAPRRRFTKTQRAAFLAAHSSICYWCLQAIKPGEPWDIEHKIPRELLPDATADADENLGPIHAHPAMCHKLKTKLDRRIIAKSNRIRRENGPVEDRKKSRHPMRSKPMQKGSAKIPSRPFAKPKPRDYQQRERRW